MTRLTGGLYMVNYTYDGKIRNQQVSLGLVEGDCGKVVEHVKDVLASTHKAAPNTIEICQVQALHLKDGGKTWRSQKVQKADPEGPAGVPSKEGIRKCRKSDLMAMAKRFNIGGIDKDMLKEEMVRVAIAALHG